MQNTSYQRRRHLGSTSASLERGATQQRVEAENFLWTSTREGDKDTGQIWRRAVGILIVAIPLVLTKVEIIIVGQSGNPNCCYSFGPDQSGNPNCCYSLGLTKVGILIVADPRVLTKVGILIDAIP